MLCATSCSSVVGCSRRSPVPALYTAGMEDTHSARPRVLVVAAELMASSRVEAVLAPLGCALRFAVPAPAEVAADCAAGGFAAAVLDLSVSAEVRDATLAATHAAGVPLIAFGSHAETGVLDQARTAGAQVLTRGELARHLPLLLAKHIAGATGPDCAGGAPATRQA